LFQAEDGIRDFHVTGVQTCALPIWNRETDYAVPVPPKLGTPGNLTVHQALQQGPKTFRDLMEATGSRDGRDVLIALDAVRCEFEIGRASGRERGWIGGRCGGRRENT